MIKKSYFIGFIRYNFLSFMSAETVFLYTYSNPILNGYNF